MHGISLINGKPTKHDIVTRIGAVVRKGYFAAVILALLGVIPPSSTAFATMGGDIVSPQFPARDQRPGKQTPVASATDTAGNTYITGYELPPGSGFEQFYTVKIASDGTVAWRAVYQRTNQPAKAVALAVDGGTGDVFVTGNVAGDVVTIKYPANPAPKAGSSDPKEVQEGWLMTFDNGGTHNATVTSLAMDATHVYVCGASRYSGSDRFMVLAYARADGAQAAWQIPSVTTSLAGMAQGIAVSPGGIAITGASSDGYFQTVKYGLGGIYAWDAKYVNPTPLNDTGLFVKIDSAGDVVATGHVSSGTLNHIHTVKYNGGSGTIAWSQTTNLDEATEPDALYIDQDTNPANRDHVYVTGHTSIDGFNHIYTIRYKSALSTPQTVWSGPGVVSGGVIFNSGNNSIDIPKVIVVDKSSDSFFVAGYAARNSNTDFLTAKYAKSTGDHLWTRTFHGVANNNDQSIGIGLDLDSGGNPYVAGYADETTPLHQYAATIDNSSRSVIEDSTTSGIWSGYYIMMTSGLNSGEFRKIASNDATSLTLALQLPNGIQAGDSHYIYDKEDQDYYVVKYDRGALNAPSKLAAAASSANAISLSWQDNNAVSVPDPTLFRVERCTDSAPRLTDCTSFSVLADNLVGTSYTDNAGLASDTYYYYRVTAHNNANGDTYPSNTAHAATQYLQTETPANDHTFTYAGMPPSQLDNALSVATSPTNGFPVVTGNSFFGGKGFDYYTIKLDRNLTKLWSQQYGEPQMIYDDVDTCLAVDNNGQIIVSGFSYLNNSGTDMDAIFTRKLDNTAATATTPVADEVSANWTDQWAHQFNAPGGGDAQAIAIDAASDSSNNIALVGMGLHTPGEYGKYDIYLLHYPPAGPGPAGSPNPGYWAATPIHKMDDNRPTAVVVDPWGDVVVTGFIGNLPNGGANSYRIYTAKLSGSAATAPLCPIGKVPGCLLWEQTYAGGFGNDEPNDVAVDSLGNIYVTGFTTTNAQGDTAFITLKYDKDGNIQWGGPKIAANPGGDDEAVAIKVDPIDGNIVVAGDRLTDPGNHDFHVVRYNAADGSELWHKTLLREGSSDRVVEMAMDRSGSVFLAGSATDSAGAASILTVKVDWQGSISGNATGYTSTATPPDAKSFSIATNFFGEAFAVGYTKNADTTVSNIIIKLDGDAIQSVYPLTAAPAYSTVSLNWADNSRSETGYQVARRNGACPAEPVIWVTPGEIIAANVAANSKTWSDSGLTQGTSYCYGVRAFQGGSYARWTNITVTTTTSSAPTDLTVTATDTTTNTVGWTIPAYLQTAAGFKVNRCTGASCTGSDSGFPVTVGNTDSYVDSSACPGITYRYEVKAYGTGWESVYTSQLNVTTLAPPSNITYGFTATWKSEQKIDLSWTNGAPDSTGYKVQRCDGSGCSNFSNIATVTPSAATNGYSDTNVAVNATYTYRVYPYKTATCNGGWNNGIPPALDFATSPSTTYVATASLVAPAALAASAPFTTQVNLVWEDKTSSETGFRIERCTGPSCTFATPDILDGTNPYKIVSAGDLGYNDTGVCNNTTYKYRIKAVSDNSAGWTETTYTTSTPSSITTPAKAAGPTIWTTVLNESQIDVNWSFNSTLQGHTGFHIDRCTASDCNTGSGNTVTPLPDQLPSATIYHDTDIPYSANNYYYRVSAYKSGDGVCGWISSSISTGVKVTSMANSKPASVSGSNSAATVSTNCDDIRVTDSAGNILPIYIQNKSGGNNVCGQNATSVVTKLDLAPGANATYYLYYGNQNAPATSNGATVFTFFDDFDNVYLDTTRWDFPNSIYTGYFSIGSGQLYSNKSTGRLISKAKFPPEGEARPASSTQYTGYILETRAMNATVTTNNNGFVPAGFYNSQADNVGFRIGKNPYTPSANPPQAFYFNNGVSTQATSFLAGSSTNNNLMYQVRGRRSSTLSDAYLAMSDLDILTSGAPTPYWTPGILAHTVTSAPIVLGRRYDDNNGTSYSSENYNVDWEWVRVRKYASPAPSASALGSPESAGPYTVGGVSGWKYRRAFTIANTDPNAMGLTAYEQNLPAFDTSSTSSFPVTDHITITWTDKTVSEDGFYIYRCAGASCTPSTTPFATTGPSFGSNATVSYTDGATASNATYCYQVAAYRGNPVSPTWKTDPSSPPVCRTTFNQQVPTNLSGTASGNQITLAWDDNSIGETSYKLERCDTADCDFSSGVTTVTIPAVSNVKSDGTVVAPLLANSANPPHATYVDTTIGCSGTFRYRLSANFLSDPGTVLGPSSPTGNIVVGELPLAPAFSGAPTYPDEQQITINWSDANAIAVWNSYVIERCTATSGSCSTGFMQVGTITGTRTLTYTDDTAVPGVQYGYRVSATINSGCGVVSSPASATVFGATTGSLWAGNELYFYPTQVAPFYQTNFSSTNLSVFTKTAVEKGYVLKRCSGLSCTDFSFVASLPARNAKNQTFTHTDSSLCPGTVYTYTMAPAIYQKGMPNLTADGGNVLWMSVRPLFLTSFTAGGVAEVTVPRNPAVTDGSEPKDGFSDIRFVDAVAKAELQYSIRSYTANSAVVWVKVGPNATSNQVYLYYGNANATASANSIASGSWTYGSPVMTGVSLGLQVKAAAATRTAVIPKLNNMLSDWNFSQSKWGHYGSNTSFGNDPSQGFAQMNAITFSSAGGALGGYQVGLVQVVPGAQYQLKAYIKTALTAGAAKCQLTGTGYTSVVTNARATGTSNWSESTVDTVTIPGNVSLVTISCFLDAGSVGTAWLGAVQLLKTDPVTLTATALDESSVEISWNDFFGAISSSGLTLSYGSTATGYRIYSCADGSGNDASCTLLPSPAAPYLLTNGTGTMYRVSGLTPGSTGYFKVAAYGAGTQTCPGNGNDPANNVAWRIPSNVASATTTQGKPATPVATPLSASSVKVTWPDRASGESAYDLYRCDNGGGCVFNTRVTGNPVAIPSIRARYTFDGTTADSSGSGLNLSNSFTPVYDDGGIKTGKLSSYSSYHSSIKADTFTVEFDYKFDQNITGWSNVFSLIPSTTSAGEQSFDIVMPLDMYRRFDVKVSSTTVLSNVGLTGAGGEAFAAGRWYRFALVKDGQNVSVYVNGTRVAQTGSAPVPVVASTYLIKLGGSSDAGQGVMKNLVYYGAAIDPSVITYVDTATCPGNSYRYQVAAYKAGWPQFGPAEGQLLVSDASTSAQTPYLLPPDGFAASLVQEDNRRIELSWTPVNISNSQASYLLKKCQGAECTPGTPVSISPAATAAYSSTGLTPETTYCYQMASYVATTSCGGMIDSQGTSHDGTGITSAYTAPFCLKTSMRSPTDLGFALTEGGGDSTYSTTSGVSNYPYKVHLKWSDNATDESYYVIEVLVRKDTWVKVGTVVGNSFIDTIAIEPGKKYTYRVRAYRVSDNSESVASNVITVATPAFNSPSAPDHTTCICEAGDGSCSEYISVGGGEQSWDSGIPAPPSGISATAGNAQVSISWIPGAGADSSFIQYGTASGTYTTVIDPAMSPQMIYGLNNGQTIYYKVGARNASGSIVSAEYAVTLLFPPPNAPTGISAVGDNAQATISWVAGDGAQSSLLRYGTTTGVYTVALDPVSSPLTITGLTNGQPLYYKVGASNLGGTAWSPEYSVTPAVPLGPPPTGIYVTVLTSSFSISWTPGTGSTSSYVKYGTTSGSYGAPFTATSPRTISATSGTTVYFRVGAYTNGVTSWSDEYTTRTGTPLVPTNVTGTPGNGQVTITWTPGAGATSSTLQWNLTSCGTTNSCYLNTISNATSPFTITGRTNGQTVYYRVGSKNNTSTLSYYATAQTVIPTSAAPAAASASVTPGGGNGELSVSWAAVPGATSYSIRYGTATGVYTTMINSVSSPYTLTGLVPVTTYYVQVGSTNASGTTWSTEYGVATTALSIPSAPTGISAIAGNARATVSWTVVAATSYSVRYGTAPGVYTTTTAAASPHVITGLANGQTIYYQVAAGNAAGMSWSAENTVNPVAPPAAPTGVSATAGDAQATLSWIPGTGEGPVTSLLEYGLTSGTYGTSIDPAGSPQTISGLTNGQTVYFRIGARNIGGTTWGAESSVTPGALPYAPAAPTGISAVAGNEQATIVWTAGLNSTSSLIRYGTAAGSYTTTIDPAASPKTIGSLANGGTVYYQVGAKNATATTWSAEYGVTPSVSPPPAAPTGVSATSGDGQTAIWWTDGAGSTSSLVKYGTSSGNYTTTIDPAVSPRTISGLSNGQPVFYRVGAKNGTGTAWSAEYSVIPAGPPAAPTAISASAGDSQLVVSWTAGAGAGTISSAIRYGTATGVYSKAIEPANSPQTISGLTNGQVIFYQVGTRNEWGTTWSSERTATPVILLPSAPTDISSIPVDLRAIVSWTSGTGSTSSTIKYGTASGSYPTVITTASSPHMITGLVNGTTYYYRVGAKNAAGTTWSGEYTVVPVLLPPVAPTSVSATTASGAATITWTTGMRTVTSVIKYGTASGQYTTTVDPAGSPKILASLANHTTYYYRVGATNTSGTTWSDEYTFKPIGFPAAPSGISSVPGNAQGTISWTTGLGATSTYIRYYGTTCIGTPTIINPAISPQTIYSLPNNVNTCYQVVFSNQSGETSSSSYTVRPASAAPAAATGISATAGSGQVTINWTPGTGSTKSLIRYGTAPGTYTTVIDPATSGHAITGLTNGQTIYYQVGAYNGSGTTWSTGSSVVPAAP